MDGFDWIDDGSLKVADPDAMTLDPPKPAKPCCGACAEGKPCTGGCTGCSSRQGADDGFGWLDDGTFRPQPLGVNGLRPRRPASANDGFAWLDDGGFHVPDSDAFAPDPVPAGPSDWPHEPPADGFGWIDDDTFRPESIGREGRQWWQYAADDGFGWVDDGSMHTSDYTRRFRASEALRHADCPACRAKAGPNFSGTQDDGSDDRAKEKLKACMLLCWGRFVSCNTFTLVSIACKPPVPPHVCAAALSLCNLQMLACNFDCLTDYLFGPVAPNVDCACCKFIVPLVRTDWDDEKRRPCCYRVWCCGSRTEPYTEFEYRLCTPYDPSVGCPRKFALPDYFSIIRNRDADDKGWTIGECPFGAKWSHNSCPSSRCSTPTR